MIERLREDHGNAKLLAMGLSEIPGISINPKNVHTNIVFFDVETGKISRKDLIARLGNEGIRLIELDYRVRAVTHYGITSDDIKKALQAVRRVMEKG